MLPPLRFTVFLVSIAWNFLPLGLPTGRALSLGNILKLNSSVYKMFRSFFSSSVSSYTRWPLTNFHLLFKWYGPSKAVVLAVLPTRFSACTRIRTGIEDTTSFISALILLENMKGYFLTSEIVQRSVDSDVFLLYFDPDLWCSFVA